MILFWLFSAFFLCATSEAAEVSSVRARFVQEKRSVIVRDVLRSSGEFLLDRNRGIVWAVEEPERLRIVMAPGGVWAGGRRVDEGLPADVSLLPMLETFGHLFSGGAKALEPDFVVTEKSPSELRLVPREERLRAWLDAIELRLDGERRLPIWVRIEEAGGDRSEIRFENLETNPELGEEAFRP